MVRCGLCTILTPIWCSLSKWVSVTKPGIIVGNSITLLGGYLLAARQHIDFSLLIFALLGMALVIASACVFNNCIDRDIDLLMERTRRRVIPRGILSLRAALIYAVVLGFVGFAILYWQTNLSTLGAAFIGFFVYVVSYSLWFKRQSRWGVVVGGIAGAMPPVVGYCAVTARLDLGAFLVFLLLFLWQLPHFYAIAIYRLHDFAAVHIPVLPITRGVRHTKIRILVYVALFWFVSVLPAVLGYVGAIYTIIALSSGAYWLYRGIHDFSHTDDKAWARAMFSTSVFIITLLSLAMYNSFLPRYAF